MNRVQRLEAEIVVLKDLLETAYRNVDKARVEAEKADDEALEHKTTAAKLRLIGSQREVALVWEWKRRAEKAERALARREGVVP